MSWLLVNEIFHSLQGEGFWTGTPAFFVRLQGCTVGCPWCDTMYALALCSEDRLQDNSAAVLEKNQADSTYTRAHATWIVQALQARRGTTRHIVITGGEPCRQPLGLLTTSLLQAGFSVQLETSGTEPLTAQPGTWVTLSPKAHPVLESYWDRADEIKLPVSKHEDVDRYAHRLALLPPEKIRLQPISQDPAATALCVRLCLERGWRLSLQTHKYLHLR